VNKDTAFAQGSLGLGIKICVQVLHLFAKATTTVSSINDRLIEIYV
jgi:phosphotransferase system IIA component